MKSIGSAFTPSDNLKQPTSATKKAPKGRDIPQSQGVIPICVPEIQGNEWKYVKECLDTNWVSSAGTFVDQFERMLADYVGAKYAVATASGTAALHVALIIAGVRPEDEVLVSDITFIAPANAVRYVGAWPVFVDAEPEHWQMDPDKLENFLKKGCLWRKDQLINKLSGRPVRAVLPVHILGHPCDMDQITGLARQYNLTVIEDATESLGAKYRTQMVGRLGDIACFSFNGNKVITTGGGGMIATGRDDWAAKAKYLTTQAKDDPIEYIHNEIGYNYRLTNLQAAVGCAQMELLDKFIATKRAIASTYTTAFADLPGTTPMVERDWAGSTFWMYTLLVESGEFGMNSRTLLKRLSKEGIQTRPLWQPMHMSPAHKGSLATDCSVADRLYRDGLSIPCSVGLSGPNQERVIETLRSCAKE